MNPALLSSDYLNTDLSNQDDDPLYTGEVQCAAQVQLNN